MPTPTAVFVPWLHMHQPPIWIGEGRESRLVGNLEKMLNGPENSEERWNAQWFARAYQNPARHARTLIQEGYAPRIMLDYSGVLLEELARLSHDGTFERCIVEGEPIGDLISQLRDVLQTYPEAIEFAGTAYSHCYFPATPERNFEAQVREWRRVYAQLFGKAALARVRGFWLPEMGMMGEGELAIRFLRLLKRCGYEWLILPRAALARPTGWSDPELENRVHWLVVEAGGEREQMLCVVRDTETGIRQQSGQNAEGCIGDARYRGSVLSPSGLPALVVPTSDGENGNVMMFEFFPNTFAPLFRCAAQWPDIAFMTVSEYLDSYLADGPQTEVRLGTIGGSWIGDHQSWNAGDLRRRVLVAVEQLSADYAQIAQGGRLTGEALAEAERAVLLCETSCFVYWNSTFWAEQAERCLTWARTLLPATVKP